MEGFIGSAEVWFQILRLSRDLTQIIGIKLVLMAQRLTGSRTPEWMKGLQVDFADDLSSLCGVRSRTYTALTDPGAAQRGQGSQC